jgi:hypothetical protein
MPALYLGDFGIKNQIPSTGDEEYTIMPFYLAPEVLRFN